jgi:hypothetical protein
VQNAWKGHPSEQVQGRIRNCDAAGGRSPTASCRPAARSGHSRVKVSTTVRIRNFGAMKLDAIGPAEIERYKARKLADGLLKKSINNHLTALRKLLNLAVE